MSSLFIQPDNQEILWKTIHKIPFVHTLDSANKTHWFKSIIQNFHEKYPLITSFKELKTVNILTIEYICDELKKMVQHTEKPKLTVVSNPLESVATRNFQEDKSFSYQYGERNKEYEKMTEKEVPNEPQFQAIKDEPLNNMEDLIKQYSAEREQIEKEMVSYSGEIEPPLCPR
jgi:hypothetical protein